MKNCPFCNSDHVALENRADPPVYFFACGECDGWGPGAETAEEAERIWNDRAGVPGALSMYDVHIDAMRDVTQDDIRRLQIVANGYGALCDDVLATGSHVDVGEIVLESRREVLRLCGEE